MEITVLEKGGGESCRFETRGSAGQCGAKSGIRCKMKAVLQCPCQSFLSQRNSNPRVLASHQLHLFLLSNVPKLQSRLHCQRSTQ